MTIAIDRRERRRSWAAFLRLLFSVMILAASATLLTGTVANLTATTVNPQSGFAAGALILSNQVGAAKQCTSTGDRVQCDDLYPSAAGPGTPATALVNLQSVGTVPAGQFLLYSTHCTDSVASGLHGNSLLCPAAQLAVHDDTHDHCYYPQDLLGACPMQSTGTLADFVKRYPQSSPLNLSPDGIGAGTQFSVTVLVPRDLDNTFQGRTAVIDFNWELTSP